MSNNKCASRNNAKSAGKIEIKTCVKCGKEHPKDECPAKDKRCDLCHGIGHFRRVCRYENGDDDDVPIFHIGGLEVVNEDGSIPAPDLRAKPSILFWA